MYNKNSSAILGLGKVNIKTGRSKYFNIYETYKGTAEVWEVVGVPQTKRNYRLVFTASSSAHHPIGTRHNFHQDQTGRTMAPMILITAVPVKDMATLIAQFGTKLSGFCYK